jgi:hypothetical protein
MQLEASRLTRHRFSEPQLLKLNVMTRKTANTFAAEVGGPTVRAVFDHEREYPVTKFLRYLFGNR